MNAKRGHIIVMSSSAWDARAADFARQLTLPEQKQLFSYWQRLHEGTDWPSSRAVRPADIPSRLLPHLLILEQRAAPEYVRVRLAGSALWDIHGGEITGATLRQRHAWNGHADYWQRIYERMQAQPMPDCGHLRDEERMAVLFWLRLPLRAENDDIWLLGLDMALPLSVVEDTWQRTCAASEAETATSDRPQPLMPHWPQPASTPRSRGLRITGIAASAASRRTRALQPRINISTS